MLGGCGFVSRPDFRPKTSIRVGNFVPLTEVEASEALEEWLAGCGHKAPLVVGKVTGCCWVLEASG